PAKPRVERERVPEMVHFGIDPPIGMAPGIPRLQAAHIAGHVISMTCNCHDRVRLFLKAFDARGDESAAREFPIVLEMEDVVRGNRRIRPVDRAYLAEVLSVDDEFAGQSLD